MFLSKVLPIQSLLEVFKYIIGWCFFSLLKSFIFPINTVPPASCHTGIALISSTSFSNANHNAELAGFNSFDQNFWMLSIRGTVQFFLLLIATMRFFSTMFSSFISLKFPSSCLFTLSIHDIDGFLSFIFQIPPKIYTNLSISRISLSR